MVGSIETNTNTPNQNKLDESVQFTFGILRDLGIGLVAFLTFLLYIFIMYFAGKNGFEWIRVDEKLPWILAGLIYVVSLIVVTHWRILSAYKNNTTIPKKTIQASEYVYLFLALIGVLAIGGFGLDVERVMLIDNQNSMLFNIDRASKILVRTSGECDNKIPERQTQGDIAHACNWIESVRDYLETSETKLSPRAWKRLDAERQQLTSSPIVRDYRLPSVELRTFGSEFEDIGRYMGFYFDLKERAEARPLNRYDPFGASDEMWFKVITICALGYSLALRLGKLTAETLGVVEK